MYQVVDAKEIRALVVGISMVHALGVVALIGVEVATVEWSSMTVIQKMDKRV